MKNVLLSLYSKFPHWYDSLYGQAVSTEVSPSLEFIQWFLTYKKIEINNPDHLILDMGAGTGRVLIPLTQKGYVIEGMEPFEGMMEIASKKADKENTKISLSKGSYQTLMANEKYKLIFGLNGTMAYLTSSEEFIQSLKNIYRALKPRGIFLVDLMNFYAIIKKYKHPEPKEIDLEGKQGLLVVSYGPDPTRDIWIHHARIFLKADKTPKTDPFLLYEDIHELIMINIRELKYYAKLAGLEFVENFLSYEDRPDERKKGSRIIAIFQKPHK